MPDVDQNTLSTVIGTTKIYQLEIPPVTRKNLEDYCDLYKIGIEKHFKRPDGTFIVPGAYFINLFRWAVEKIHEKNPQFPISQLDNITMSCGSRKADETIIFIGEALLLEIEILTDESNHERICKLCKVEIRRPATGERVLFGIFNFIEYKKSKTPI
jgi:hypothetical protein